MEEAKIADGSISRSNRVTLPCCPQVKEEEEAKMKEKLVVDGEKRVVEKLLGRRKAKKGYEYEVQWVNGTEVRLSTVHRAGGLAGGWSWLH